MKRNQFSHLAVAAALVAGLAACTPNREDKPPAPKVSAGASDAAKTETSVAAKSTAGTSATATPAAPVMAALPKLGTAPKWTLKDLKGNPVSSEQLKGKVVVVDFWATWCGPCRVEIPGYVELQNKYGKDGLVIVGVSVDQAGPEVVQRFVDKERVNYTMVMADEAVVNAFGGVEAIPTTFLIDRSGQIRDRKVGAEETSEYEKKIAAVMAEKA